MTVDDEFVRLTTQQVRAMVYKMLSRWYSPIMDDVPIQYQVRECRDGGGHLFIPRSVAEGPWPLQQFRIDIGTTEIVYD